MNLLRTSILATIMGLTVASWAIPAKPVARVMQQPDGSEVVLTLAGDEYCHYYLTDDNQVVVANGDAYYFASIGQDGCLAPTVLLASNADSRTAAVSEYLQGVDARQMAGAIEAQRLTKTMRVPEETDETSVPSRAASDETWRGVGLFPNSSHPLTGSPKGLVILVEYADVHFTLSDDETRDYFSRMLMQEGFDTLGGTGSAYDFFRDASNGQFLPQFDVYGPVALAYNRAYYGGNDAISGNDKRAAQMIKDGINALAAQGVDFSPYDNDGDGVVENVFVFYAGEGEAQTGVADAVWPHSSELRYYNTTSKGLKVGDVYLNKYACSSELCDNNGTLDGIGTFVHEFSHVLGLPDLYSTSDGYATFTPLAYSCMDGGAYNNNSRTPPTYSVYERNAMGWIDLTPITEAMDLTLEHILTSNHGYVIPTPKANEFFLLENRQKTGWDKYIPGHGMLIWHIDYKSSRWTNNNVNTLESHQYVDLEEACNKTSGSTVTQRKYPFPGTGNVKSFTDDTAPSMLTWDGTRMELPITEITEKNNIITAKVAGGAGIADMVADGVSLSIDGLSIKCSQPVCVYDAMGRTVAANALQIQVPAPGLYIVLVNGQAKKFLIK